MREFKAFRLYKKQIKDNVHPTTETLFDYAVNNLPISEQEECLGHIAHCVECAEEVYLTRIAQGILRN